MKSELLKPLIDSMTILLATMAMSLCCGCAGGPDPYEKVNRAMYNFNDGLDRVLLKPVSDGYVKGTPLPIRDAIGNGFDNLHYFNVVLNDFLQAKWGQGLGDAGRMATNSTIGVGGIFDVASYWGMPKHDNDFGITLGKWGAGPGPYLVIPVLGPSSFRDAPGYGVEYVTNPTSWLCLPLEITVPLYSADTINTRSHYDSLMKFRSQTAIDPYVYTRQAFLQYRENRIHEGKPAADQSIYDEEEDSAPATTQF